MGAGVSLPNWSASSTFHCAMLGLDSAGKTTVLYRLKFDQYVNTAPTIGFNCEKIRTKSGSVFSIWDVGGQDKLRPLWRSYTRCTDGIIFVVDSCKEDRLEEAKLELLKISKSSSMNRSNGIPVLVLANKQDLPAALDPVKLETLLGLKDLGPGVQWRLQSTCAITGDGLEEGMASLQEMIAKRRKLLRTSGQLAGGSRKTYQKATRKVRRTLSHHY